VSPVGERRPRASCPVCGRRVALTAGRGVIGPHNALPSRGSRCAGAGRPVDGGKPAVGGVVVRLPDAVAMRETRRRVALAERLAELEVYADGVAKSALKLVTDAFPALVEALELVLATPKITDADDGLLERLVRAEPERARRVLERLTGDGGG
jgi:hypothetical protein